MMASTTTAAAISGRAPAPSLCYRALVLDVRGHTRWPLIAAHDRVEVLRKTRVLYPKSTLLETRLLHDKSAHRRAA